MRGSTPPSHPPFSHPLVTDLGEARPELGHATNASIILGRRELTEGRFLDRRAFLPSYDPFNDTDEGKNLETILGPALVVASGISLEYLFSTIDGGAGTKCPMNLVGHFGVQQGSAGDLLVGLPTQMTEMHSPLRATYLIDAPIARVEAVLGRREELKHLVRHEWVLLYVRDPQSGKVFRQSHGEYLPVLLEGGAAPAAALSGVPACYPCEPDEDDRVVVGSKGRDGVPSFAEHDRHAKRVARRETAYTLASAALMLASLLPPLRRSEPPMEPSAPAFALAAVLLGILNLGFSYRYLHGEFLYGRFALLSAGLVCGFNLVALAPSVEACLPGWSLLGFASTFLIGAFNDRATARDNATFVFLVYQLSDASLLVAADADTPPALAVAALLFACLVKSGAFPLCGLLARSMEGASPNSALGYAGLSSHAGLLLLCLTHQQWATFGWARLTLAAVGLLTAATAGAASKVRADLELPRPPTTCHDLLRPPSISHELP